MKEQLITFDTAKLAKEKGFNIKTPYGDIFFKIPQGTIVSLLTGNEDKNDIYLCLRPTQSFLQKWLREKHNMLIIVYSNSFGFFWERMDTNGGTHRAWSGHSGDCPDSSTFTSYEKALEKGLIETLKLIKK